MNSSAHGGMHLRQLEDQPAKHGWLIRDVHEGDDYRVSTTLGDRADTQLLLDVGLFGKKPTEARPDRPWGDDLAVFVYALDTLTT